MPWSKENQKEIESVWKGEKEKERIWPIFIYGIHCESMHEAKHCQNPCLRSLGSVVPETRKLHFIHVYSSILSPVKIRKQKECQSHLYACTTTSTSQPKKLQTRKCHSGKSAKKEWNTENIKWKIGKVLFFFFLVAVRSMLQITLIFVCCIVRALTLCF